MREMVRTWFQVKYGIQCLPVVGNLFIQPSEVELILNVVLIHLWYEGGEKVTMGLDTTTIDATT